MKSDDTADVNQQNAVTARFSVYKCLSNAMDHEPSGEKNRRLTKSLSLSTLGLYRINFGVDDSLVPLILFSPRNQIK